MTIYLFKKRIHIALQFKINKNKTIFSTLSEKLNKDSLDQNEKI